MPQQSQLMDTHAHNRAIYGGDTQSPRDLAALRKDPTNPSGLTQKIKYRPTTSVVRSCGPLAQSKKLELLLEGILPSSDEESIKLFTCVRAKNKQGMADALAAGADVDYVHPNYNSMTALMNACCDNWMQGAEELISEYDANVNLGNAKGDTPLMKAILHQHADIADLLIKKGANVHAVSEYGCTPTSYAIQTGITKLCELVEKEKKRQIDEREEIEELKRTTEHLKLHPIVSEEEQMQRTIEDEKLRLKTEIQEVQKFLESRKLAAAWFKLRDQEVTSMQVLMDLTIDDMLSIGIHEDDANKIMAEVERY